MNCARASVLLLVVIGCSTRLDQADEKESGEVLQNDSLRIMRDQKATEDDVMRALSNLPAQIIEDRKFWTNIANDSEYNKLHRRVAVYEFFKRHVRLGTKLSKLTAYLDGPTWLEDENVSIVTDLAGYIPVELHFGETVIIIVVFPELGERSGAVCVRVGGEIELGKLRKGLRNGTLDNKILEIGFLEL